MGLVLGLTALRGSARVRVRVRVRIRVRVRVRVRLGVRCGRAVLVLEEHDEALHPRL